MLHFAPPTTGFLRLSQIIGQGRPLPISRSSWWAGVKTGRYPAPVKLGPRMTAWRVEDICDLIDRLAADGAASAGARSSKVP